MDQTHSDRARPKRRRRVAEPRIPESDVLPETMLALSRAGALVQRNNSGLLIGADGRRVRVGMKGAADILACYPVGLGVRVGLYLAVECKSSRGRLSKVQKNYRTAALKAGALHFVVKSEDDIAAMIDELERARRWLRGSNDMPDCLAALIQP